MFIKLEPEEYIKTDSILSDSENPKTPWYNGIAIAPEDSEQEITTIIAYSTEPEDDDEVFKFRDYLNSTTEYLPSPISGISIEPYHLVFGLNTISRLSKLIDVRKEW